MSAVKIVGIAVKTATIEELAHERPGLGLGLVRGLVNPNPNPGPDS